MNAPAYSSGERHVYRLKWWAEAFYLAIGIFCTGVGSIGIVNGLLNGDWSVLHEWGALGLTAGFLIMGYIWFGLAFRSRLVLEGTRVSVRGAFSERTADISEIKGYRITMSRAATYWHLDLRDGRSHLLIMRTFRVDDVFREFLAQLKNLDEVKHQTSLGSSD